MSDEKTKEKIKWQKTNRMGFNELVDNLQKITKVAVKRELDEVMGKINILEKMGVLGNESDTLKEIREKYSKIIEVEK